MGSFNLTGRFEYLLALQQFWPEFWQSLRSEVLDVEAPSNFDIDAANRIFYEWVLRWGVIDDWLQEAAWQTLCTWSKPGVCDRMFTEECWFVWIPSRVPIGNFEPRLDNPSPGFKVKKGTSREVALVLRSINQTAFAESPAAFEKRMLTQFRAQLKQYRKQYEQSFWTYRRKPSLIEHANWTALYQKGETPKSIRNIFNSDKKDQAVLDAIHKFSDAITLTLRPQKAGPPKYK